MSRVLPILASFALVSGLVFGQTSHAFDVADVHVSPHSTVQYMRGGVLRSGRFNVRTATMVDLIGNAWGVDAAKVIGGPAWLETDRFDITARAPVDTPSETVKLMLQTLLAERFSLKVHSDNRPIPVFVLSVGKGKPKLQESDEGTAGGCRQQPPAPGAPFLFVVIACRNLTMEQLAQELHNYGDYLPNPVVDQTGLKGAWDFDLKWTPRGLLSRVGADSITIFDAVEKQLGLKLEPQKLSVPVIVADSVNQKPIANPSDVTTRLPPPPPPEFEVATIRPSKPDATNQIDRLEHDRLDGENIRLKDFIMIAWELNGDELIAGLPKFAETVRYDITAKAPPPPPGAEVDIDDLRLMVRALFADRFGLKTHMEERQVDGYVLSAIKPKLRKADPSNRTGCKEGPGPDGKDPRLTNPVLSRLLTCQNITLAQFADLLPTLANGYAHTSVLDTTGLTDAWDLTLSFSAVGLLRSGATPGQPPPPPGAAPGAASDPNGAVSLPDAISRELGLKLELKKRPTQVLVIDHLDEKPTEN